MALFTFYGSLSKGENGIKDEQTSCIALYRGRAAGHILASPASYKADPEFELKPSPILL